MVLATNQEAKRDLTVKLPDIKLTIIKEALVALIQAVCMDLVLLLQAVIPQEIRSQSLGLEAAAVPAAVAVAVATAATRIISPRALLELYTMSSYLRTRTLISQTFLSK
jgi:hypothetical protein